MRGLSYLLLLPFALGVGFAYWARDTYHGLPLGPTQAMLFHDNFTRVVFGDAQIDPTNPKEPLETVPAQLSQFVIDPYSYPDLYKFKPVINIEAVSLQSTLINVDQVEQAHTSPTGLTWWSGNEVDWEVQLLCDDYPQGNFTGAYTDLGYIVHLRQDITVPAHVDTVFHGFSANFLSSFLNPYSGLPPAPYNTFHYDNFERAATILTLNYSLPTTEAGYAAAINRTVASPFALCILDSPQFWLQLGAQQWGAYGIKAAIGVCGTPTSSTDLDFYPNDSALLALGSLANVSNAQLQAAVPNIDIAQMAMYLAVQHTQDVLQSASQLLAPVVAAGTPAITADFSQGASTTFSVSVQENRSSSVNLVIQDTITGRYLQATVNNNLLNLDKTSSVNLTPQNPADLTKLPYGGNLTVSWNGAMTDGGSLAAGGYSLSIAAVDGDGNWGFAPSNIQVFVTAGGPTAPATLTSSCDSLAFPREVINLTGAQVVGLGGEKSCTLTNNSAVYLTNPTFTFSGANAGDFDIYAYCDPPIAPYSSCPFDVVFTPAGTGNRSGSLQISGDETPVPLTIALTGVGQLAPSASFGTAVLSFSTQQIGTLSAVQNVKVTNSGAGPLTVSNMAVHYTNYTSYTSNEFMVTGCNAPVATHSSCTIGVVFAPLEPGNYVSSLDFNTNDPNNLNVSVTIVATGAGVGATSEVSPVSLTFPATAIGNSSAAQNVTVTNPGTVMLTLGQAIEAYSYDPNVSNNVSDFAIVSPCTSVSPGSSCTISLVFQPTAPGSRAAALQIDDNERHSPAQIYLTGNAAPATPIVSPASLDFGVGGIGLAGAGQTVTVMNPGTFALAIEVAVTGANPKDFAVQGCGIYVAAGATCNLSLRFKATAIGSRSATLQIVDGALGSPQTVALTGVGEGIAQAVPGAPSSDFGAQIVGASLTQTVTLSNPGTGALGVNVAITGANAGDFSQTGCPSSVGAGQGCSLTVTFTPAAAGNRTAAIVFSDNALNSPQTVNLTGAGAAPPLQSSCDLIQSGAAVMVSDVQQVIAEALGVAASIDDLNSDGAVNIADVEIVANAALGLGCSASLLNFGNQPEGTTNSSQSVVIAAGATPVTTIFMLISGDNENDLAIVINGQNDGRSTETGCGSIPAGGYCTVAVFYTPSICGSESASLQILTSAGYRSIALEGVGFCAGTDNAMLARR